ncbi:MAG: hypothetical protein ACRDSP_20510 [Pseudonocardiaceae bacterium]
MRRGDNNGMGGIDHSICPSAPVPATVLVVVLSDGSCLLVGYPQGEPSAFVIAEDAMPLRHALAAAFGSDLIRGKATQP